MSVALDIPDIRRATLELLRQVPRGKVTTYRALALALGDPRAVRAVGQILADNDQPDVYPCYKVVHSDGRVGEYSAPGGTATKIERLQAEGIPVQDGLIPNLKAHVFYAFKTDKPLLRLQALQEELARRVLHEPLREDYRTIGGVDLSYKGPWQGVGAYVLMEIASQKPLAIVTEEHKTPFPYIPTYLAFRELPVLLPLLEDIKAKNKLADVIMVDGSGILHPRHLGIASQLGVLLNIPTIGVTKTLLYGRVELGGMRLREVRSVIDPKSGETIGAAVKTHKLAEPIFISVGHGIALETAVDLVLKLSSQRLPEPIRLAHEASREAAHKRAEFHGQKTLDL